VTPAARRRALVRLRAAHRCSERRACGLVGLARSVARYRSRRRDDAELRARLRELAGQHRRFGYLRLHALLRQEGLVINRKRTYRLYQAEDLAVRRRRRRRPPERERLRLVVPERRNQRGSMDFASDALWTGRCFRCLCIVDDATRESPALLSDFSIGGARVVRVLDELAGRHGLPAEIVMDNGPEFTGRAPFAWSARTGGVGCGGLQHPLFAVARDTADWRAMNPARKFDSRLSVSPPIAAAAAFEWTEH
jgi:putative transposase